MNGDAEVFAAGGVVLSRDDKGKLRVLIVHRPGYDDWTLPKGKLDPGETWEAAAVREVHEETGVTARLGIELPSTVYADRRERTKQVRWWVMVMVANSKRAPDDEVDQQRWVRVGRAANWLTHSDDQRLVEHAVKTTDHIAVLVVRHAFAGRRATWKGNDLTRPLSERGSRQARAMATQLAPWHVTKIISSPLVRATQTVQPLAKQRDLEVVADDRAAEGATWSGVKELFREASAGTVICSHGDVIGGLVGRLADGGIVASEERLWQKGSTWVVTLDGDRRPVAAAYLPPPA